MVDRAEKSIGDASTTVQETAKNIWSHAGEVTSGLAEAGHRRICSTSCAMLLGAAAIGCFAQVINSRTTLSA